MKPITGLPTSFIVTVFIIAGLAFLAAKVPVLTVATADEARDQTAAEASDQSIEGLEVIITGIRGDEGKIIVLVFDEAEPYKTYDYTRAVGYGEISAKQFTRGMARVSFPELSEGLYAVSLFHDANDDDDFNMNGVWPLEGYGTSGAESAYDEPGFAEAAVPPGIVRITMFYLD